VMVVALSRQVGFAGAKRTTRLPYPIQRHQALLPQGALHP